jgi:hypothetical protein
MRLVDNDYVPLARILCIRCGAQAYARSGTKICDCPPMPTFFISAVRTAEDDEPPDDVA